MLGAQSVHAEECFSGNFIGADYGIVEDLTDRLPEEWRDFNVEFIPSFLAKHPDKTKIAAGLACGMLWTVAKGMQKDDVVLCPNGLGQYHVAEVVGDYYHAAGKILPHRRTVQWLPQVIDRNSMSQGLKNTTGSIGTLCNISKSGYTEEIERSLGGTIAPALISSDPLVEDPSAIAMEKQSP